MGAARRPGISFLGKFGPSQVTCYSHTRSGRRRKILQQMREITPVLTRELEGHCSGKPVWRARPFQISTFRALVEHVARLAYANRDESLFFRGQDKDYQSKAGGTTLYPTIYRGDPVALRELKLRFASLDQAARLLVDKWKGAGINGYKELRQKRYIQWSILQHYEVANTPLLDFTQSLRVACSFAQIRSTDPTCYVYVLGLPYVTNRITINSEHDTVNIRLLSICPPAALRPYFQEGYLAGTTDVTSDFDSKTELDFRNRLIAKFAIPRSSKFWGPGFQQIPETALFPRADAVLDLCNELKSELEGGLLPGDLGEFIREWAGLEEFLLETARRDTERNVSVREAIFALTKRGIIPSGVATEIHSLRKFRNRVVHEPSTVSLTTIGKWLDRLDDVLSKLDIPRS
jgi:FRG domain-containing protein